MAKPKRPVFIFPELESRGRRAILRTTEEVSAEIDAPAAAEEPKERVKVTYRFRADAVEAGEDIRRILRRESGVRQVDRGAIPQARGPGAPNPPGAPGAQAPWAAASPTGAP